MDYHNYSGNNLHLITVSNIFLGYDPDSFPWIMHINYLNYLLYPERMVFFYDTILGFPFPLLSPLLFSFSLILTWNLADL